MNHRITFTLTGRQIIYALLILTFGIGSLMSVGQAFAQHPNPAESSCDSAGQTNVVNGLGHVTYNCGIWIVRYHGDEPYLQWSPLDVSAGNEGFPGAEEWYPNTPGTVLPNYPVMDNPAPRNLVTNEPLDVTVTNGVISILPSEGNGSVTVVSPDNTIQPNEESGKKGFRCKATGNGYQLNDVSLNADNTGFFVEVTESQLSAWDTMSGQDLNEAQSDFCGSLDPNAPAVVTVTNTAVTTTNLEAGTTVTLNDGSVVNSDGAGNVSVTDVNGVVVASGTDGVVTADTTVISVPVDNEPAVQPADAVGLGSGNSMSNPAHEDTTLVCEPNGSGTLVCHKP